MKIESLLAFISVSIGIFCHVSAADFDSGRAVQIIKPENHSIQLQLDELKSILEADDIKDRHVVVVSIAGAMRKGKSFLLNFFIRYLYAQVSCRIANTEFFQQKCEDQTWFSISKYDFFAKK